MKTDFIQNPHLEGDPFFWSGGPIGVLLIHGFTATTAEVRPLGKFLHEKGYTVAGPLVPGHFTHPQDLNRVSWKDWVSSVEALYLRLKKQCEKVIVGGESNGGLLSLYMAEQHPEIAAVLLYAPALRLTLTKTNLVQLHLLAPFVPWITPQPGEPTVVDDRWQGYPVRPLKGLLQLLALQRQVLPNLAKIQQPTLIIQGCKDTTVHPAVPQMISDNIKSSKKEIHWMEKSAHCVALDCEIEEVFKITHQFLSSI
jgi:carboxylesterase